MSQEKASPPAVHQRVVVGETGVYLQGRVTVAFPGEVLNRRPQGARCDSPDPHRATAQAVPNPHPRDDIPHPGTCHTSSGCTGPQTGAGGARSPGKRKLPRSPSCALTAAFCSVKVVVLELKIPTCRSFSSYQNAARSARIRPSMKVPFRPSLESLDGGFIEDQRLVLDIQRQRRQVGHSTRIGYASGLKSGLVGRVDHDIVAQVIAGRDLRRNVVGLVLGVVNIARRPESEKAAVFQRRCRRLPPGPPPCSATRRRFPGSP